MWLKCDLSRSDANEIERWEYHWVLVDSQGVEAGLAAEEEPRRLFLQGMASSMANGEPYVLWRATDLFPRRSPWMILRAYARRIFDGQIVPAGELVFSNPAYDPDLPNWKAESTPVVRTFEGHRFQCDGLSISRQAGGRPGLDFPVATLKVRSICSAGVCSHWRPSTITITTASGNSRTWTRDHSNPATEFWGVALSEKELPGEWCFEWWLWDDEPSYAVEVEWLPDPVITLAPGEFCYVPAVRLPAEDGVTRINVSTNLAGVPVKVLAVVGEHASFPERLRDVTATSTLEIEVGEVPTSHRFLVIDRALPEEARIGLQALEPGLRSFRLPSKTAETSHVDLCLAIYRRCLTRCIVRAEFGREER